MTFIEQWFHVDPDGGNGALETLIIVGMVLVVTAAAWARRSARFGRKIRL